MGVTICRIFDIIEAVSADTDCIDTLPQESWHGSNNLLLSLLKMSYYSNQHPICTRGVKTGAAV